MIKKYLKKILKEYPNLSSGRKNYKILEKRIQKNIILIKKTIIKNKLKENKTNKTKDK